MNEATKLGLEAHNKSKQAAVQSQAQSLIGCIENNLKAIASYEANIKTEQDALAKLASDVPTIKQVLGTEFTGTLNANQTTIMAALNAHIATKQGNVTLVSQKHVNNQDSYRKTIGQLQGQIDEWRKQLNALSVDVVTAAQVTG